MRPQHAAGWCLAALLCSFLGAACSTQPQEQASYPGQLIAINPHHCLLVAPGATSVRDTYRLTARGGAVNIKQVQPGCKCQVPESQVFPRLLSKDDTLALPVVFTLPSDTQRTVGRFVALEVAGRPPLLRLAATIERPGCCPETEAEN